MQLGNPSKIGVFSKIARLRHTCRMVVSHWSPGQRMARSVRNVSKFLPQSFCHRGHRDRSTAEPQPKWRKEFSTRIDTRIRKEEQGQLRLHPICEIRELRGDQFSWSNADSSHTFCFYPCLFRVNPWLKLLILSELVACSSRICAERQTLKR